MNENRVIEDESEKGLAKTYTRTIDIEPKPAIRMTHQGRFSQKSQEYLAWQGAARLLLVQAFKGAKIDRDANIRLSARFVCRKKKGPKPDLNNLVKALEDALQDKKRRNNIAPIEHGVIHNDVRISEYGFMKRETLDDSSGRPRIIVTIEAI